MSNIDKYALLGFPVKHSVSPQMQMAGFNAVGIDASYELIETSPENLANTFEKLRQTHRGWNITVPHKEASYHLVDRWDESAKVAGCVNTVSNEKGILTGYSTDGFGLQTSLLESFDTKVKGTHFTFLGAGGASQSVALHFASQGAKQVDIINRSLDKAQKTAKKIQELGCLSNAYSLGDDLSMLANTQVIIQGTSLGLKVNDPTPISKELIPANKIVIDMIYKETPFLQLARNKNCQTTNGFGMLLYQGTKAWEIWTGLDAPVKAMRLGLQQVKK